LLHQQTPNSTIFSSAEWVDAWLSTVGRSTQSHFLIAQNGEQPVAICLLTESFVKRGPFRIKTIWFGTAGEPEADSVYVEYVDILCLPGYESAFAKALHKHLQSMDWDEFILPRMQLSEGLREIRSSAHPAKVDVEVHYSRFVNLHEFRLKETPFEATLSQKLRKQIRQSLRFYNRDAPLALEVASTAQRATELLDHLADLHEASWRDRGLERGAFGSEQFRAFHRRFLESTYNAGHIQLARAFSGDTTVGIIYNIVDQGTVYFYQSGLAYLENKQIKPGFVCQVLCIEDAAAKNLHRYDFMCGDTPYKQRLANCSRTLQTVTIQRNSLKMRFIEKLRILVRKLRHFRSWHKRDQVEYEPEEQ
jgi:hypothetical protein